VNKETKEVRSMKKVLMILMALMISVAFVTTVMAAKDKPKSWAGEVVSADTAAKTVVGKNEQGEMTFDVSKAKFAKDVKFKDLIFGDKILIQYRTKDGKNMATSLDYAPGVKTEKTQGEGVDDSWITTKVKSMLAGDASLNPFKIHVETIKGNVQLTGTVDSKKAADKAVQITKSVKGVKSVKSNLIVK
jgi:hypothetical protein